MSRGTALSQSPTRSLTWAALLAALIASGAFIVIPLGPVPFTLQVLFVLMAGMILGPRLGALSVTAYLLLGLIAPVYAGGTSGLGVLFGPTGGFLIGFIPGAMLAGLLARRSRPSLPRLMLAGLAGLAPIYALGAAWLALQLHLSAGAAIAAGVTPFIALDVAKALVAALATRSLSKLPLSIPAQPAGR